MSKFTRKTKNHKGPEYARRRKSLGISEDRAIRQSGIHWRTFKALEQGKSVQVAALGRYSFFLQKEEAKRKTDKPKLIKKRTVRAPKPKPSPLVVRVKSGESLTIENDTILIGDRIRIEIGK